MWLNNTLEHNGNDFNQNNYPMSPFDDPTGPTGHPYFPLFQSSMIQCENTNAEGFMDSELKPEVGIYNKGAFAQNQFVSTPNAQFSFPSFNSLPTSSHPTPLRSKINIPNMNSRAAELKAQLLKKQREKVSSVTPPLGQAVVPQPRVANGSNSLRGSPRTPATTWKQSEHEININELISQFSDPKPTAEVEMEYENNNLPVQPQPEISAKSQKPSLGSPAKGTKAHNGKVINNGNNMMNTQSKHASSESMSEGEIFEEPALTKALPGTENGTRAIAKSNETVSKQERNLRNEESVIASTARRNISPRRALPHSSIPQPRRSEIRRDEADLRQDQRADLSNPSNEQKSYLSESNISPHLRRNVRNDDHVRSEIAIEKRNELGKPDEQRNKPTFEQFLPHDKDLKEWLEITGYHNEPYRIKTLNRRRAIAALDAQRNALLAEIEAEERGIQLANRVPTTMLPPPIPNKIGDRSEPLPKSKLAAQETQHDRIVSKKRTYSEARDIREDGSPEATRTNDYGSRAKHEDDDYGRIRPSGNDASHRRPCDDRRDGHGRARSRERNISPASSGRKAFGSRSPPRTRGYEGGQDFHVRDRDIWEDRGRARSRSRERRQFVIRRGYQGRAYDPNYRGRGRGGGGRGRGDFQSHTEPRGDPNAFGSTIDRSKP